MTRRIVIRHTGGTRMYQTDEFSTDGLRGITAGRDETANVRFDPQREDVVSREHLRITPASPGSDSYLICDLNSRNGTFLNRQRITQPTPIHHNDVVQLGLQGPEFRFELDPPPPSAVRPTRLDTSERACATREISTAGIAQSRPIGRATVERMLGDTFGKVKKESNKTLWIGVAAIALIAIVGITTFVMLRRSGSDSDRKAEEQRRLLLQMSEIVQRAPSSDPALKTQIDQISGELKKVMAQNEALQHKGAASVRNTASGNATPGGDSSSYDELYNRAAQELSGGDPMAAYRDCQSLISLDANRWEGYFVAGVSLVNLQHPSDAVGFYQYALQLAPADAQASISQKLSEAQSASATAAQATPPQQ